MTISTKPKKKTTTKRATRAKKTSVEKTIVAIPKPIRATRFDALTDVGLVDHWRWTDSRSIDASLDSDTRRRLRERARYEVANNSYAMGVALAIADATVGSGARLQILSDLPCQTVKRAEWAFADWQESIGLAEKLRAMRFARLQDGESFAVLYTNERLESDVKLDVRPIDCERVAGEYGTVDPYDVDGVLLDKFGNPSSYRILTRHPGDANAFGGAQYVEDAAIYPAASVLHWYRRTTAEQHRGCSELAASLNLFALLRRYTLAVVTAAETAADLAAVMYTDAATEAASSTPFETLDIERGQLMTLPDGWKVGQLKAEQPTTTYREFKREILAEIGRSLHVPLNIMAGDSSNYNYASGRLDHQEFARAIRLDQTSCSSSLMRPIFKAWWREYAALNGLDRTVPSVAFYYDGFEHVDPVKEANAQATRLSDMTTNLSIEYGKQGRDWEEELIQIAKERAKMEELGLTFKAEQTQETDEEDEVKQ